jgi:hypothetical protein
LVDTTLLDRTSETLRRRYRDYIDAWELRLASRDTNRVVREFDWGFDWTRNWPLPASHNGSANGDPAERLRRAAIEATRASDQFYGYRTPSDFRLDDGVLRFTSPVHTPSIENNTASALWFPAPGAASRAVIVLPQWNSKLPQQVGLCRLFRLMGISSLRLSLPYHDARMPPELERADYAVSANVARTVEAARQAVIDTRSCLDWLESRGYRRLGIVGTSLGSCYAFLASAHDARLRANVFTLYSYYFADVVWNGLSTRHIRQGLDGQIELNQLQEAWMPITPQSYTDRYIAQAREAPQGKKSLFISTVYDTTFLPEHSKPLVAEFRRRDAHLEELVLPCGHYTLGQAPFQYIAGHRICSFLERWL